MLDKNPHKRAKIEELEKHSFLNLWMITKEINLLFHYCEQTLVANMLAATDFADYFRATEVKYYWLLWKRRYGFYVDWLECSDRWSHDLVGRLFSEAKMSDYFSASEWIVNSLL